MRGRLSETRDDLSLSKGCIKKEYIHSTSDENVSMIKKKSSSSLAFIGEEVPEGTKDGPRMIRKKSGELVRPAFRGHRYASSIPGISFPKAVRFDSHLEYVRHFLAMDRPLAPSDGLPQVEYLDKDSGHPFTEDSCVGKTASMIHWELITPNLSHDSLARKMMPVRLEQVWLSNDQRRLLGSIAVINWAFHKSVVCRFTLDNWNTVSEIDAQYKLAICPRESPEGHDRFTFAIELAGIVNLESKALSLCIRYIVIGQEYWDNNNGTNFRAYFKKNCSSINGERGFQYPTPTPALNGIDSSNNRQTGAHAHHHAAASFDLFDYTTGVIKVDQPIHEYLDEPALDSGLRFKSKSASSLASDNIAENLASPTGVDLCNRYDIAASLRAAVKATKVTKDIASVRVKAQEKDILCMKKNRGNVSGISSSVTGSSLNGMQALAPNSPIALREELLSKHCFIRGPDLHLNRAVYPTTA